MTSQTKAKVDRARASIEHAPADSQDSLHDLLSTAESAANGAADKVAALSDAMLALALYEVRQAVKTPEQTAAALAAHTAACPLRSGPGGKLGLLWAFRWPLAIASFAPGFPSIIDAVKNMMS